MTVETVQPTDMTIECVVFGNLTDTTPVPRKLKWAQLVQRLSKHEVRPDKDGRLWSPATYKPGATRHNAGVLTVTAAVGDFDNVIDWVEMRPRLETWEYVVHSTHRHSIDEPRFRVVIPLVTPVTVTEWAQLWPRIRAHVFSGFSDVATKDPSRAFYMPSHPPGSPHFAFHHPGLPLDSSLLSLLPAVNGTGGGAPIPTGQAAGAAVTPLGKAALDFVANGAPLGEQRSRALKAARNYLSSGYTVEDTTEAVWRGLQASPQDPERGAWCYQDAAAIVHDLSTKDAPPLELEQPLAPRSEMQQRGLGYVLNFPLQGVTVHVERLRRGPEGPAGMIRVEASIPLVPRHVAAGNVKLASLSSRTTLIKHLTHRAGNCGVTWDDVIEEVCRKVLLLEQAGEPFQTVGNLPPAEELTWVLKDFAPRNEGMTIFGEGGSGKSLTALAMALSVQTGVTFVPGFPPLYTGPVLYLDWEAQPARIDKRIKGLCAGLGMPAVDMAYRRCQGPLSEQVEEVMRFCASEKIVLVVVDSVEAAMAGSKGEDRDPNDSVQRLYAALRLLKCSAILVDHVSKEGLREKKGHREPIGGVAKKNLARMAFELRKGDQSEAGIMTLGLYNTKRNDDGALLKARSLQVLFGTDTVKFQSSALTDPGLADGLSQYERILLAFKQGTCLLSLDDLSGMTGLPKTVISPYLSSGKNKTFVNPEWGKWGLKAAHSYDESDPPF